MTDTDGKILSLFSIILYRDTHGNKDLLNLYNTLDDFDDFIKVITLFSGRKVQFPTKEDINEAMLLSVLYYYRIEQKMEWKEIKSIVPTKFNVTEYAFKLREITKFMKDKINKIWGNAECQMTTKK